MKLLELHIDDFGIFSNKRLAGFTTGMHVIFGPNEFGKSTLLAFINRILFGFPSKARVNPYPAISGHVNSGKLKCQLANGNIVTIARKQGARGGTVTKNGESSNNEIVRQLFNNISSTFFESVYAIDLSELEKLNSLETDEVKAHIYSASLGLEHTTFSEAKRLFEKTAGEIFTSGLSKRKLISIFDELKYLENDIAEVKGKLSQYDELVHRRDELLNEAGLLESHMQEQQELLQTIKNRFSLFDTYIDLRNAEMNLREVPDSPDFLPDSLSYVEKFISEIQQYDKWIEEEVRFLDDLKLKDRESKYNEQLVENESLIESLHERNRQYKSSKDDLSKVTREYEVLEEKIRPEIGKIEKSWTIDTVRSYQMSYQQENQIRKYNHQFEEIDETIDSVRNRIHLYQSKKDDKYSF